MMQYQLRCWQVSQDLFTGMLHCKATLHWELDI